MSAIDPVKQISEALTQITEENEELREGLADVRAALNYEDTGWQAIFGFAGGDRTEGLDLAEVQSVSEKARTKVAAAALEKRAADLHAGYVFSNGVDFQGTIRDPSKTGAPPSLVKFYEDDINQENLFSEGAMRELQRARFTDGNVIVLCDTKTKQARRVPIKEISNVMTNPDFPDEIWAWQRTWDHHTASGESMTKVAWIYTNRFKGVKKKSIAQGNGLPAVPVLENMLAVDLRANRQVGWVYGLPDALAGMLWTEAYGQVLRYGQIVNESLAKVVYKVVQKTKKGAQNAGVKLTTPSQPGGAAVVGEGQDIQLVNSSQRSFDFTAARPLAAMAASAWNVTNPDLLNDSSASGSSYGSLNALVLGNLNAMLGMQVEWTQFFQDVFVAFGHGRIVVEWAPIESPDPYREGQIVGLAWNMGLVHPDEARPRIMEIAQIKDLHKGKAPEGVLLPNNKDSWERADIDPKDGPATGTATSTASPDQGVSNGTGGAGSTINNDTRTDNLESLLRDMAQSEFLTEFRNLVERFEAAKG